MLFPGIEVPTTYSMSLSDASNIKSLASNYGESLDRYFECSIGLVAIWGSMIEKSNFSPNFKHGLTNNGEIDAFDIDELFESRSRRLSLRESILDYVAFCDPLNSRLFHPEIEENTAKYLRIASGFYGYKIKPLVGLAVGIRNEILEAKELGEEYIFSADQLIWTPVNINID